MLVICQNVFAFQFQIKNVSDLKSHGKYRNEHVLVCLDENWFLAKISIWSQSQINNNGGISKKG